MKINTQNIDTYLMSYIDNELSLSEIKELELFIKAHPVYEKELALLKQTVLEAEEIEYEDKQLLYRYSEMEATLPSAFKKQLYRQEAKVVEGFFTRTNIISISSIAALLLLFVGYRFYTSGNDLNKVILSQNNNKQAKFSNEKLIASTKSENEIKNNKLPKYKIESSNVIENRMFARENLVLAKGNNFDVVKKAQKEPYQQQLNNKSYITNEQYTIASTVAETEVTPNSNTADLTNKPIDEIEPINNTENTKQAIANTSNQLDEKESYESIDTDDQERSIYIANLEIDGDKLRGFTRRINALFKRNKNEKQK